ncbi:MAG: nucleotidyltransferase family protein [Spirochaetia bacterium]|nr:nucleotidyltransferase family protein [Spirochaetia bacterium]
MNSLKLTQVVVPADFTIKEAINKLNENTRQILLVANKENRLLGTITDGDIRRAILKGLTLDKKIEEIMNKSPLVLFEAEIEKAEKFLSEQKIRAVPIVNSQKKIIDILFWEEIAGKKIKLNQYSQKENKVFILAGGKGSRLKPFTNILPKPLIPIGEVPIIEIIMKRFQNFGFNNFILSLNYKAEMLKAYFADDKEKFNIEYVQEKEFSGTAGSLSLVKKKIKNTIFVSNCDIIIDINYDDFFNYHKKNKHHATIVGVIKHVKIPYGVLEIKNNLIDKMTEKPEYDFMVNSGIYCIEPNILNLVPDDKFIDMPNLLLEAQKKGLRVGVYPVTSDMIDVGHWDEYNQASAKMKKIVYEDK